MIKRKRILIGAREVRNAKKGERGNPCMRPLKKEAD